jgi:negative regulator of flagellin synthesis FlgM
MKIDQNVTFLKTTLGTPTPARNNPSVTAAGSAATSPARPSSPTPLLPSTSGDFDAARVAEIRESIRAGRYEMNPGKIADGLLASVRDLLNAKSP